eukprot:366298-Chlamydomonas_euryale.AAC.3
MLQYVSGCDALAMLVKAARCIGGQWHPWHHQGTSELSGGPSHPPRSPARVAPRLTARFDRTG